MTDLRLFDLSTIPFEPFRTGLARLTDEALYDIENDCDTCVAVVGTDEDLGERLTLADVEWPPLPDTIKAAIEDHYEPLRAAVDAELARRAKLRFLCLDCGVDTLRIGQYPYHCPDELWRAVVDGGIGMLCLTCLARRLDAGGLPWPWSIGPDEMATTMRLDATRMTDAMSLHLQQHDVDLCSLPQPRGTIAEWEL